MWQVVFCLTATLAVFLGITAFRNHAYASYDPSPVPPEEVSKLAVGGWELDHLPVDDAVTLVGLVRRPRVVDAPWVLFFPGNGSQQLRGAREVLERIGDGEGWGLAAFANRGFDASGGTPSPEAFHGDARAIFDRLQASFGAHRASIHLVGFSMGAEIATHLAADLASEGATPASLTLISSYTPEYRLLVPRWYGRLDPFPDHYDPSQRIDELRGSVLVLHATDDDAHPIGQARDLARRLGAAARFVEVPGRHVAPLSDPEAIAAIRELVGDPSSLTKIRL